ncbi:winged helix-turn-helix transcriptional regulator [Affinibrenneria salicis]|uniref:Winged helix-turn-helix transcriptional regulator n=1 Tax=Affinibrenneria salicis TaxID=2590031 RepID=A0A5J5FXK2_9GAMM|nr:winged helix-turn-helix domain-containing protein [Affinibrenneria salicis]KAA8998846.1 winged helix-turn-helix transcriptional regulator [Affinibrenneria salicis]
MINRSTQIRALASEQRLEILRLLRYPNRHFTHQWSADPQAFGVCVTLIAGALKIAQPTASRHIDLLRQAGFITVQRYQKWAYCQRDEQALSEYVRWLSAEMGIEPHGV